MIEAEPTDQSQQQEPIEQQQQQRKKKRRHRPSTKGVRAELKTLVGGGRGLIGKRRILRGNVQFSDRKCHSGHPIGLVGHRIFARHGWWHTWSPTKKTTNSHLIFHIFRRSPIRGALASPTTRPQHHPLLGPVRYCPEKCVQSDPNIPNRRTGPTEGHTEEGPKQQRGRTPAGLDRTGCGQQKDRSGGRRGTLGPCQFPSVCP